MCEFCPANGGPCIVCGGLPTVNPPGPDHGPTCDLCGAPADGGYTTADTCLCPAHTAQCATGG